MTELFFTIDSSGHHSWADFEAMQAAAGRMESTTFFVDVAQWVKRAHALADDAFRATVLDAVSRVKELTPVRTGYLRSNCSVVPGSDVETIVPGTTAPPEAVVAELKLGDAATIINPVVYAMRVEFGFVGTDSLGRHYDQKGAGMMQQTVHELPAIAQGATARVIADQ